MGSIQEENLYEVIVVGGGFGGSHCLYNLRKFGFKVHMYEAGSNLGGTWHWNRYPGARVDTEVPIYQFTSDETWDNWNWSELYPGWREIQEYFNHVSKAWDLGKDISFQSRATGAQWNEDAQQWTLTIENQLNKSITTATAKFVVWCSGLGSAPYLPKFKGAENFKGDLCHSARWPDNFKMEGKRAGVIGTGASGVQIIQDSGPKVKHLTVFQRTPNTALPMKQKSLTAADNAKFKKIYPSLVIESHNSWSGFLYTWNDNLAMEATEAERDAFFEQQWAKGGFNFYVGNFKDVVFTKDANETAYQFWRKKTASRINDPVKREKLAPAVAPHPFGTKRPSLERAYYEVYNQENVDLVDVLENPIEEIVENGVRLKDGTEIELDVLVYATGFDSVSGGLTSVQISNEDGLTLKKKWANGISTYLGMGTTGFPNLFWVYGPQAPTGFANGPTCIETQGEWIVNCLRYLRREGFTRIEADATAEKKWREHVLQMGTIGLFHEAKSWYFGSNIPGKPVEALNYMAGMPAYRERIKNSADNDYEGFHLS